MFTIGVLTISDSGAAGAREDTSGETIRAMVTAQMSGAAIEAGAIIPDERELIEGTLREWSDEKRLNLILTTAGHRGGHARCQPATYPLWHVVARCGGHARQNADYQPARQPEGGQRMPGLHSARSATRPQPAY
jgi:hypothetical protein